MFSLREFIKKGLLNAVGKMADYQVILNSVAWFEKGVLQEEDLAEINEVIDKQYIVEEPIEELPTEEEFITEETPSEEVTLEEVLEETQGE